MRAWWKFIVGMGLVCGEPIGGTTKEEVVTQLQSLLPNVSRDPFSVGATQRGWEQGDLSKGVREVYWTPNTVMRLVVRDYMSTTIKLPEWESIVHYEVGEDGNFIAKKVCTNILTLRAVYAGCDTSLTVIGKTGNVYTFYVQSISFKDQKIPDLVYYVMTSFGKENKDIRTQALEDRAFIESKEEIPFDPSALNFNYGMWGDESIAPQTVYSDGIFTWLDYGKRWNKEDLPTVYHLKDDVESPVNTRIEGTKVVIEAVGEFVLKSGEKRVCIFAETDGAGHE